MKAAAAAPEPTRTTTPSSPRSEPVREVIPRRAVMAAGAGLVALMAYVGMQRLSRDSEHAAPPLAERARALHFKDRSDGGIDVVDADTNTTIDTMHGEQGFLRGTLRALARERRGRGLGSDAPLLLARHPDVGLAISDPATGQRIELAAFGSTNAEVFARWMPRLAKE